LPILLTAGRRVWALMGVRDAERRAVNGGMRPQSAAERLNFGVRRRPINRTVDVQTVAVTGFDIDLRM
jgi:hypothetical protein